MQLPPFLRRHWVKLTLLLILVVAAGDALSERGARIVEGHGDLRAEHVYLGPPVAVIDCLEFDRELRLLDPAEEIALLTLEIEQLGRSDLAESLLKRFRSLSAHPAEPPSPRRGDVLP